jgi:hypothetical protein
MHSTTETGAQQGLCEKMTARMVLLVDSDIEMVEEPHGRQFQQLQFIHYTMPQSNSKTISLGGQDQEVNKGQGGGHR